MHIILLGAPGAGKGTQAQWIAKNFAIAQISTGDMLRSAVQEESALGKAAKEIMDTGRLVPDDIIIALVQNRISKPDCQQGFLLDGFPRTIPQAKALQWEGIDIDHVIEIDVPDEEIITRLSGRRIHLPSGRVYHVIYNPPKMPNQDDITGEPLVQRDDDNEATIRNRLAVYYAQTRPLVEFYKQLSAQSQGKLKYMCINGNQDVEKVYEQIDVQLRSDFS